MGKLKVLILGGSGMLGSTLFRKLHDNPTLDVYSTIRSLENIKYFKERFHSNIITGLDINCNDSLTLHFLSIKPNIVINCIGIVKQLKESDSILSTVPINTILPHRLANLCALIDARLIHFSTDCVFSGTKGMYLETDLPDATDIYGRSKLMGEVYYPNSLTLRTSIIGHELNGARSLVGWFLSQNGNILGYKKAIFSGLPTVEVARIIDEFIIPNSSLHGLYHLSANPINKFELLQMIATRYKKRILIEPDEKLEIDRSLDSTKFKNATGYKAKPWDQLIGEMYEFN